MRAVADKRPHRVSLPNQYHHKSPKVNHQKKGVLQRKSKILQRQTYRRLKRPRLPCKAHQSHYHSSKWELWSLMASIEVTPLSLRFLQNHQWESNMLPQDWLLCLMSRKNGPRRESYTVNHWNFKMIQWTMTSITCHFPRSNTCKWTIFSTLKMLNTSILII